MYGLDVSQEMVQLAQQKIEAHALTNAHVGQGSVEHITEQFPETSFDLIYVFFGALNTVEDIERAFECLSDRLEEGGRMVLTFVNKWYLQGMLIELLKGRPVQAFSRLKKFGAVIHPRNSWQVAAILLGDRPLCGACRPEVAAVPATAFFLQPGITTA